MVQFPYARARWILILMTAAAFVSALTPVAAAPPHQTGTPIHYGETLSGEITEDAPCQYSWFEGAAGDLVTIDMTRTSGSLDGVLMLYRQDDFTADPVASNDDRPGGGLDPLISVALPAADWYTIAACRLQADQMRVTTGTFALTLSGPEAVAGTAVAATPTPAGNLSDTIFGSSASPTPGSSDTEPVAGTTPAGSPTPGGNLSDVIPGGEVASTPNAPSTGNEFADGNLVMGQLAPDAAYVSYSLPPVITGEIVQIHWEQLTGDAAPLLRVLDPEGAMLAEASSPDQIAGLFLSFRALSEDPLTLIVARYEDAPNDTTSEYILQVITTAPDGETAALVSTPAPVAEEPEAAESTDEADPICESGDQAVMGSDSTDRVSEAYTAAGDSYTADQLTRTWVFATDDDLNVVLRLQNLTEPVTVTAMFCSPDGDSWDGGVNKLDNGGPYLLGLDWESSGVEWTPGNWFVEIVIDDTVELTIGFTVE